MTAEVMNRARLGTAASLKAHLTLIAATCQWMQPDEVTPDAVPDTFGLAALVVVKYGCCPVASPCVATFVH
ncbi:hypothetical protein SAMN05216551_1232 [Chitinasiproducens palmae]|uniref:Uncharacterized protein n=1 Tax=Chitinasiproducens palmae TaxID=1770053 RepID=A0A1H2PWF4_9BURK|nr:hypothetical protein SAMN05216551_1232 [Chitinasiproducens palmae]